MGEKIKYIWIVIKNGEIMLMKDNYSSRNQRNRGVSTCSKKEMHYSQNFFFLPGFYSAFL